MPLQLLRKRRSAFHRATVIVEGAGATVDGVGAAPATLKVQRQPLRLEEAESLDQ